MAEHTTLLGIGIYSRAEVARLLQLTPGRVGTWVRGYRYAWGPKAQRRHGQQPSVIKTDIPRIDGVVSVSFLELMELKLVKRLREERIPLQTVRVAWRHAAKVFGTTHPFADQRVFVDRGKIFMALRDEDLVPDVLEVSSRGRPFQVLAGAIAAQSIHEIEFNAQTRLTQRWWPSGRNVPIVLDPSIAFGAPVIDGTRVPTGILARYAEARPIHFVADAFELSPERVEAAVAFERQLALAA